MEIERRNRASIRSYTSFPCHKLPSSLKTKLKVLSLTAIQRCIFPLQDAGQASIQPLILSHRTWSTWPLEGEHFLKASLALSGPSLQSPGISNR